MAELSSLPAGSEASEEKLRLARRVRGGALWFFCVAGLTLLHSAAFLAGRDAGLVVGLGASEVFHALVRAASVEGGPALPWILAFCVAADLLLAGFLILTGLYARRLSVWAAGAGTVLYGLDGLLLLAAGEPLGALFHACALAGMIVGAESLRRLRRLDDEGSGLAAAAA